MAQLKVWWRVNRWLLLGMVLVAVGIYGGLQFLSRAKQASAAPVPTVKVWVIRQALPADSPITPSDLTARAYPIDLAPPGYYTGPLTGLWTTEALAPGVPLVVTDLYMPATSDSIAARLPKGDVAIDLPTAVSTGVDGVIAPGDRISLLVTAAPAGAKTAETRIFLRHLAVLAVNGNLTAAPTPGSGEQLILAVTPAQALAITYGEAHGSFTVMLERPHQHLGTVAPYPGTNWPTVP